MAVAGGVTTANIMPGSANVIGGQTLYVKLRGRTVEEMRIKRRPVLGGLKMANGDNPKGSLRATASAGDAHENRRLAARAVRQGARLPAAMGRLSQGRPKEPRPPRAARHRPGHGVARRSPGAQANRALSQPSGRRPHDRHAHRGRVRFRACAAPLHRGLPNRRRNSPAENPGVADAGRQPGRQAGSGRPAGGERGHLGKGRRHGRHQHRRFHHRIAFPSCAPAPSRCAAA